MKIVKRRAVQYWLGSVSMAAAAWACSGGSGSSDASGIPIDGIPGESPGAAPVESETPNTSDPGPVAEPPVAGTGGSSGMTPGETAPGPQTGANPFACDGSFNVGTTPLVRMSSAHIRNSIAALFGVEADVQALSVADERVGAFVSNFSSPVTEPVVDQYKIFAEDVGRQVAGRVELLTNCPTLDEACAVSFIDEYAPLVYRRPLREGEATRLLTVYQAAGGDFADGIALLVEGMLQSPFFLYRIETEGQEVSPGVLELTPFELATRLSFALTATTPDRQLFDAAASGALTMPGGLLEQASRLLEGPDASVMFAEFHRDWLGVGNLDSVGKSDVLFPEFSSDLTAAMATEVTRFTGHVMQNDDARLETLLTASYSLLEPELDPIYGVTAPVTDRTAPVELDPAERSGILTLPAVLTVNADQEHGSPVLRGVWVRENLLCQTLPDPPENVDTSLQEANTGTTTRERFEIHTQDPACAGCHALIDPIGLGFEHYDAIGRYRDVEAGSPVDASGSVSGLMGGSALAFNGVPELAQQLLASPDLSVCMTRQWFRYTLARPEAEADNCSVGAAYSSFQGSDYNVKELIQAIVASDAFRHTKGVTQ